MFQWDAVDTSPDLGGRNVLKTFEIAIRHSTNGIGEFCVPTFKNIFIVRLRGPPLSLMDPPLPYRRLPFLLQD